MHRFLPNHPRFIARTVMVENNDIEKAMQIVNGIMTNEGLFKRFARQFTSHFFDLLTVCRVDFK